MWPENPQTLDPRDGPTTASAVVDGSWPLGNYRLDEIDVTDGNANKAAYDTAGRPRRPSVNGTLSLL
jgi:hypothetical protein